jgi:hypothetical protein
LAEFEIDWFTIDAGGEMRCAGGDFDLSGTIGQPDASRVVMSGGTLDLTGGFWVVGVTGHGIPGDCDGDHDVDLADFVTFAECITGPDGGVGPGCSCADLDRDNDADLADFTVFQYVFTGLVP